MDTVLMDSDDDDSITFARFSVTPPSPPSKKALSNRSRRYACVDPITAVCTTLFYVQLDVTLKGISESFILYHLKGLRQPSMMIL